MEKDVCLLLEWVFHSVNITLAVGNTWYDTLTTILVCLILPSFISILIVLMAVHKIGEVIIRKKLKHSSYLTDFVMPVILFAFMPLLMLLGMNQWRITPDILYGLFATGIICGFASGLIIAIFMAGDYASIGDHFWVGLLSSLIMGGGFEGLYFLGLNYLAVKGGIETIPIPGAIGVATGLCVITGSLVMVILIAIGRFCSGMFVPLKHKQCCIQT